MSENQSHINTTGEVTGFRNLIFWFFLQAWHWKDKDCHLNGRAYYLSLSLYLNTVEN
jgi:hypothetical protein